MAEDPAVELLLARRDLVGGEPADVDELLAPRQPGDGGVAAAVERAVDGLAGGDVEHVQQRLLVPAAGHLVGQQVPLLGGLPGVERGRARGVQRDDVEQDAAAAVALADVQDGVLLARLAAGREGPVAAPGGHAGGPGVEQGGEAGAQPVAPGQGVEVLADQALLGVRPGLRVGGGGVLEPAVGVGDGVAVQVVDQVQAGGVGVGRHPLDPRSSRTSDRAAAPVQAATRSRLVLSSRRASTGS